MVFMDLGFEWFMVVYPGDQSFPLADRVDAVGLGRLLSDLAPLRG